MGKPSTQLDVRLSLRRDLGNINMEEKLDSGENSPLGYLPNKISEAPQVIRCHLLTKPRNLTNLSSLLGGLTSVVPGAH